MTPSLQSSFLPLALLFGTCFGNVGCHTMKEPVEVNLGTVAQRLDTVVPLEVNLDYLLQLPKGYAESEQNWPLMLFLHGAGERGDDVSRVAAHGPPALIQQGELNFPGIVISPQCPKGDWWTAPEQLLALGALRDSIEAKYRVDSKRIYLTGLSMGGFGSWALARHTPERFAAVVPVCGGGDPLMARQLKDLPIWVFHGAQDPVIELERSEEMVNALKAKGANPRFTVYPEVEHDSWVQAYSDPALYQWLLKQSR